MNSRMLSIGLPIALWLLAVLASDAAAAECFCLVHPTGAVLRGCTAWTAANDRYATAACVDPETGATSEQTLTAEWQRLADGVDRCTPCRRPAARRTPELPRGGDETEANASAQRPSSRATGANP